MLRAGALAGPRPPVLRAQPRGVGPGGSFSGKQRHKGRGPRSNKRFCSSSSSLQALFPSWPPGECPGTRPRPGGHLLLHPVLRYEQEGCESSGPRPSPLPATRCGLGQATALKPWFLADGGEEGGGYGQEVPGLHLPSPEPSLCLRHRVLPVIFESPCEAGPFSPPYTAEGREHGGVRCAARVAQQVGRDRAPELSTASAAAPRQPSGGVRESAAGGHSPAPGAPR